MSDTESQLLNKKVLEKLSSKKEKERLEAEETLNQLGDKKLEVLLNAVTEEAKKRRASKRCQNTILAVIGGIFALIILVSVARGFMTGNWKFFDNWASFFSFFGVFGASAAMTQSHKNAALKLAEFDDLRSVGPLLDILDSDSEQVKQVATESLKRLLPRLQASDSSLLNDDQLRMLGKVLESKDAEFVCAALKALEQVGDEKHLDKVQRLAEMHAKKPDKERIREAAQACLPYLTQRVENNLMAKTLLRASSGTDTGDVLLRPVDHIPDHAPQELLRPVLPVEETTLSVTHYTDSTQQDEAQLQPLQQREG
jgi:ABC-type multidrug transport system fused ATPase/permease subunit